ncbi:MAG: sigma-70 family RNA polymerase sigma factor [Myxococcota bacterium]|nr:sigma-70 family RNA polymerase sigma factor [Myxococcota bacterium]
MFLAKDKDLLARFQAGETDAMDTVYRHYSPGVTRFLRSGFTFRSAGNQCYFKGIPSDDELRNAVQEAFRRAFEVRARNAYNGINSFSNWILAIARNMVINGFRNREVVFSSYISGDDTRSHITAMDNAVSETYSGVLYSSATRSQDTVLEQSQLKVLIAEFMKELADDERSLLVLRFVENVSQEEAAAKLKSSRMKIRTAEAKLRKRLRAFLRGTGYTDHLTCS